MNNTLSRVLEGSLALAVFTWGASGQVSEVSEFENKRIVDVQFSPAQPLDPGDLAKTQLLKKGELFHAEAAANAIDALFATGRFEDIVVEAEPSGDGVVVRFVTQTAWFVGGLSVQGKVVAPPNRGQIASTAQISLGAPFRDEDLAQALKAIKSLLKANGFYEAELACELERDHDAQQIFITVNIQEGR